MKKQKIYIKLNKCKKKRGKHCEKYYVNLNVDGVRKKVTSSSIPIT